MTIWVRTFATLEDPSSVPRTHVKARLAACTCSPNMGAGVGSKVARACWAASSKFQDQGGTLS